MTAFDFSAAERECEREHSLRVRASEAYEVEADQIKAELLAAAQEMIHEILDEPNGRDVEVAYRGAGLGGDVELTIDNIRFKVEVRHGVGQLERKLLMRSGEPARTWVTITELVDVGRELSKSSCYAVRPEVDGRGSE